MKRMHRLAPMLIGAACPLLTAATPAVDALRSHYLNCAREATHSRISGAQAGQCSQVAERLLARDFDGDLDRMLAWWRSARDTAPVPPTLFEQAQLAYERGHHGQAHHLFARLADCGHREAARIALEMRRFGPQLYGRAFMVGPKRLARWRALLAGAGAAVQPSAQDDVACPYSLPEATDRAVSPAPA